MKDASLVIGPSSPVLVAPRLVVAPRPRVEIGPASSPVLIEPALSTVIPPTRAIAIEPPPRAVWDDRGWNQSVEAKRTVYEGRYRVPNLKQGAQAEFAGRIVDDGRHITAFINDPPAELRQHPKAACFRRTTGAWFQVNWYRAAKNPDDALLYVEKVLAEALSGRY